MKMSFSDVLTGEVTSWEHGRERMPGPANQVEAMFVPLTWFNVTVYLSLAVSFFDLIKHSNIGTPMPRDVQGRAESQVLTREAKVRQSV